MRSLRLCSLVVCAAATAQGPTVVVPSAAATTRPTQSPFYIAYAFYSTTSTTTAPASRSQTIVDTADIAPPAAVWNSIEFRRPIGLGNNNPAVTTNCTLMMSLSTTDSTASTTNFANNHGMSPVTLISGNINIPARANQAAWPAPWEGPFPFGQPFPYVGIPGGSLVIDIHQDQSPTGATSWYLEYTSPDLGGRSNNGGSAQSQCRFSGGTYNSGLGYTTGGLQGNGGTWYVNYSGLQANLTGIAWIGFDGEGSNWGGVPLPIDLGQYGAPGCRWSASMVGTPVVLTTGTGTSARWPNQTIPNDPSLRGGAFYDHSLWVDPPANQLGIVMGWSSKWSIGTGIGAPAAFVYAIGNSHMNATGSRIAGGCPTFQFQ